MKRTRLIGALAAATLLIGLLGAPATAAVDTADAGVFNGSAIVAKRGTCNDTGELAGAGGGGIGLPVVTGLKSAFWEVRAVLVTALHGTGSLLACGELTKVPLAPQGANPADPSGDTRLMVGAACGISKGYNGRGFATLGGTPKSGLTLALHDLGWKTSAGGSLPVMGWAVDTSNPANRGSVVAVVQAQSGSGCANKQASPGGPFAKNPKPVSDQVQSFAVAGTFVFVADGLETSPNDPTGDGSDDPVFCKRTGDPLCYYPSKKQAG